MVNVLERKRREESDAGCILIIIILFLSQRSKLKKLTKYSSIKRRARLVDLEVATAMAGFVVNFIVTYQTITNGFLPNS